MSNLQVTAAMALAAFAKYLGIGEQPPGSNKNAITAWFGFVGAWCMMTISKVLYDCGVLTAVLVRPMAYTVDGYLRGKAMGWLVSRDGKYQPGDLVFFNFGDPHWGGRPLGIHHVGMCIADLGGGMFACREGNTDDDCRNRVRNKSNVAAVVRPPWMTPKHTVNKRRVAVSALRLTATASVFSKTLHHMKLNNVVIVLGYNEARTRVHVRHDAMQGWCRTRTRRGTLTLKHY